MTNETDDDVFLRVKTTFAKFGAEMYESYQDFLADNRTFDPYWEDGWAAITQNTVEQFAFGRDAMIDVGREHSGPDMVRELAYRLDRAAAKYCAPVSHPGPYN